MVLFSNIVVDPCAGEQLNISVYLSVLLRPYGPKFFSLKDQFILDC